MASKRNKKPKKRHYNTAVSQPKAKKPVITVSLFELGSSGLFKVALVFIISFVLMEMAYNSARDTAFSEFLIDHLTVATSASIIDAISEENVVSRGNRILSPTTKLTVNVGCEGTETLLLLIAAILAVSIPWQHKILGILFGSLLVYGLNQIRVIGLYYALRTDKTLFDALHGYIAPMLIILIVAICFSLWMSRITPRHGLSQTH